jgi:hypothetical protein
MSTFNAEEVSCPRCERPVLVTLVESANVVRMPHFRDEVLSGTFMSQRCDHCGLAFRVEQELLYTDLPRGVFIMMFPRSERGRWRELEEVARAVHRQTLVDEPPAAVRELFAGVVPRLVFGFDELREKVLCDLHGLDDRLLELLKALLMRDASAGLERFGGHELRLMEVGARGELSFALLDERGAMLDAECQFGGELYGRLLRDRAGLAHLCRPLFEATWVHVSRLGDLVPAVA